MKLVRLDSLFDVKYGHSLELNRLVQTDKTDGIAFVSRKSGDNGIDCYVEKIQGVEPNPAGDLTCALGGSVLSTFYKKGPITQHFILLV